MLDAQKVKTVKDISETVKKPMLSRLELINNHRNTIQSDKDKEEP